jgi:hypothetical protein
MFVKRLGLRYDLTFVVCKRTTMIVNTKGRPLCFRVNKAYADLVSNLECRPLRKAGEIQKKSQHMLRASMTPIAKKSRS